MADLHDDLAAIADEVRRTTPLSSPAALRARSDRRHRQRMTGAAAGLAVLAVAGGVAFLGRQPAPAPRPVTPASASPSVAAAPSINGARKFRIDVAGMGRALAIGPDDDDRILAVKPADLQKPATWTFRPLSGQKYQIVYTELHGDSQVCMAVVHDQAPGTVRDRVCDATSAAQAFTIAVEADGTHSIFNGQRYVQVVDGPNTLVPDLPEALTTTYQFVDLGPAPTPRHS
jgi:hypothetical protein